MYALNQSRPPVEVVICDSSADLGDDCGPRAPAG
jgi:hypothetical protein